MSLNKEQLLERIIRVDEDIKKIRNAGADEKKIFALMQYKEYLEDELKLVEKQK